MLKFKIYVKIAKVKIDGEVCKMDPRALFHESYSRVFSNSYELLKKEVFGIVE